jgi:hypothetical protein
MKYYRFIQQNPEEISRVKIRSGFRSRIPDLFSDLFSSQVPVRIQRRVLQKGQGQCELIVTYIQM